jgi:ABC-type oligopeptide transport system ATPase subunit
MANNFQKAYEKLEEVQQLLSHEAGLYGHGGSGAAPQQIGQASALIGDAQRLVADLGWPDAESEGKEQT